MGCIGPQENLYRVILAFSTVHVASFVQTNKMLTLHLTPADSMQNYMWQSEVLHWHLC